MSRSKPTLTLEAVQTFLQKHFAGDVGEVSQLVEGEESQAFAFGSGGKGYVIRINQTAEGFYKDAFAYSHFRSLSLPIPKVLEVGLLEGGQAFCISERAPGITLQDADAESVKRLLEPTFAVWSALGAVDVARSSGFGDLDSSGQGRYGSWRDYLLSILDPASYDWESVWPHVDRGLVARLTAAFSRLVGYCPEERRLVHGDFGSNNVLTDGQQITAVLDWEAAKYGDALFDAATAYFWRTWLTCMDLQAAYYEARLEAMPRYHERVFCYQLRIGLAEIYDNVLDQDWEMAAWAARRSAEILSSLNDC